MTKPSTRKNIMGLLGLILLGNTVPLQAARVVLMLDNSGSMAGFYTRNEFRSLADQIRSLCSDDEILYFQFNQNGPESLPDIEHATLSEKDTLIDRALEEVIRRYAPDIIWILTDNYQDSPGEHGDVARFYSRLEGEDIKRINIFPAALRFDGPLILYCDARGAPSNVTRLVPYNQRRGLVLYAVLINDSASKEYEEMLTSASRGPLAAIDSPRLLCKPLTQRTVEMQIVEAGPIGFAPPNLKFNRRERKFYGTGFEEGKPISAFFYTRLQSNFDYLRLMEADLLGKQADGFRTIGFKQPFVQSHVLPNKLAVPLEAKQATDLVYRVNVETAGVKIKTDIPSLLRAAVRDKGYIDGRMVLILKVPKNRLEFTKEILSKWNTSDICDVREANQRKIYQIGTLIPRMAPEIVSIPVVYDIRLEVKYPKWPLYMLIVSVLVFGLLVFGLYRLFSKISGVRYEISINGGEARVFKLAAVGAKTLKIEDGAALKLIKRGSKVKVRALGGYTIDDGLKVRTLANEDSFRMTHPEGEQHFVRFNKIATKQQTPTGEDGCRPAMSADEDFDF